MPPEVLSNAALNRATLARQFLLERSTVSPTKAVHHLVGLQAQIPLDPYLALWSRLADFDPHDLGTLIEERSLVRIVVMRGTIHLVTANDALTLRPLMQPVLDAEIARHSEFAPHLVGVDVKPVLRFARKELAKRSMTGTELRSVLADAFPDHHAAALAYACRCYVPLVQVPPRGVWGKTLAVTLAPLEDWVGRPLDAKASLEQVLLRYLAAFGPASVADAAAWSRLTRLGEAFAQIRPKLRSFADERGRELFDLLESPRPDPDTPAPVRFLPEYDNVLLSHSDRSRFSADWSPTNAAGPIKGTVLVDGRVRAVWHGERDKNSAVLIVEHGNLTREETQAVAEEAEGVSNFWHHAASDRDIRLQRVD